MPVKKSLLNSNNGESLIYCRKCMEYKKSNESHFDNNKDLTRIIMEFER